jgi:hypothetical protein
MPSKTALYCHKNLLSFDQIIQSRYLPKANLIMKFFFLCCVRFEMAWWHEHIFLPSSTYFKPYERQIVTFAPLLAFMQR